jgi:hypothetical protein
MTDEEGMEILKHDLKMKIRLDIKHIKVGEEFFCWLLQKTNPLCDISEDLVWKEITYELDLDRHV